MPLELEHIFFRLHTHTSRGCSRAVPRGGLISIRVALVLVALTLWAAFLALHLHFVRHALPGALCLPERIVHSASGVGSNASFHLMHIDVAHDSEASSAWRVARAVVEQWACRSASATAATQATRSRASFSSSSAAAQPPVADARVAAGATAIARLLRARMCRQAADTRPADTTTGHGASLGPLQPHRRHGLFPTSLQPADDAAAAGGDHNRCALGSLCGPVLALPCGDREAHFDTLQPQPAGDLPRGTALSDPSCPVFWQVDAALDTAAAAVKADLGAWLAGGIVKGGWSLAASALAAAKQPLSDAAQAVAASAARVNNRAEAAADSSTAASCVGASGDFCTAGVAAHGASTLTAQGTEGSAAAGESIRSSLLDQAQEEAALLDLQAAWPEADLSVWLPPVEPAYVHAPDRGLLHLAPASRDALGLRRLRLRLSSADPADCLAPHPLLRWLLQSVAGYDTAIINGLLVATGGRGFVTSLLSHETHALASAADVERATAGGAQSWLLLRAGTLLSAFFLLFACSALVSFVLAQTQARMLRFTVALQQHVRSRLPLARLVASHLLDSLIFVPIGLGTLFFLFEYIGDQLLALLLLLLVIGAEVWAATALRTIGSLRFFPRLFVTLLTWFNAYYLSFPFGYHYLALATVAAAIAAAMFHLWLRYELPALVRGEVSHTRPRHPLVAHLMQAAPPPLPTAPAHRAGAGVAAAAGVAGGAHIGSPGRAAVPPLDVASAEVAAAALANPSRPRAPSERMGSTGSSVSSTGTRSGSVSRRGSSGAASPVVLAVASVLPQQQQHAAQRHSAAGFAAVAAALPHSALTPSSSPAAPTPPMPAHGTIAAFAGIAAAAAPTSASAAGTRSASADRAAARAAAAAASAAFLLDELASLQALVLPSE